MSLLEENLDVVDDNDQVLTTRTYTDCHRFGLRHRAVHLEIYSDTTKHYILVLRRAETKNNNLGRLEIPGGHVHTRETYEAAAIRELAEETGLTIPLQPIARDYNKSDDEIRNIHNRESVLVFVGYWNGEPADLKLDRTEATEARWALVSELMREAKTKPASVNSAVHLFVRRHQQFPSQ